MSARTATFVSPIVASLLAGAPFAATSHGATNPAETSRRSGPKGVAPQGGHWYYRVDRDTKRHCWYVGDARQKKARTAAEHTQPAAPVASPADTAIQPSIANARAELLSPQTRAEETNAATAQQAVPAMIANANQRANAPDANAQRSIIASRWPESSSVNAPAVLYQARTTRPHQVPYRPLHHGLSLSRSPRRIFHRNGKPRNAMPARSRCCSLSFLVRWRLRA